jgi:YD repeat-containing protein
MKNMKKLVSIIIIVKCLMGTESFATSGFPVSGAPERITDEVINLKTGEIYLETRDISIPGNGGMDLNIYRSFAKFPNIYFTYMRNWELEIPRVIVPANPYGETAGGRSTGVGLCEDPRPADIPEMELWEGWVRFFDPTAPYDRGPFNYSYTKTSSGIWSLILYKGREAGIILVIPGQPTRTLVPVSTGLAEYPPSVRYVTEDHWVAECYASNNTNGRKDAFLVRAPDGSVYIMDQIGRTHGDHKFARLSSFGHSTAYATRVTDKNGNNINYEYSVHRGATLSSSDYFAIPSLVAPTRVYSDDGREVKIYYDEVDTSNYIQMQDRELHEPPVSKIETNTGQIWSYHYINENMDSVTGPEGLTWSYEYNGPIIGQRYKTSWISRYSYDDSDRYNIPHVSKIITPSGATVDYTYREYSGDYWGGPNKDIKVQTLSTRTVSGGGLAGGAWTYALNSDIDFTYLEASGPNKKKQWQYYKAYNDWKYGRLRSIKTKDTAGQVLREEVYTWTDHRRISDLATVDKDSYLPVSMEHRGVVSQRVVDGSFDTTFSNFDDFGYARTVTETGNATRTISRTFFYDAQNWVIGKIEDESIDGLTIDRTYDNKGQLQKIVEYGITTEFEYHPEGDLWKRIRTKDGQQIVSKYENFYRGIPRTETRPDGVILTREVNPSGTIASEYNGRSFKTSFSYDLLNRMTTIVPPAPHARTVVSWPDFRHKETLKADYLNKIELDGLGNTLLQTEGHRTDTTKRRYQNWRYDADGRRILSSSLSERSDEVLGMEYTYDALDRLSTEVQLASAPSETYTTSYCYAPGCGPDLSHGVLVTDGRNYTMTFHHRAYGEPEQRLLMQIDEQELSVANGDGEDKKRTTIIQRNPLGDISDIQQGSVHRTYTYKPGTRLVETLTQPETGVSVFTYDEVGNLKTRKVGASNITTFFYDSTSRLTSVDYPGFTEDASYGYDANDNLVKVTSGAITWDYKYNALDNLIKEELTLSGGSTGLTEYLVVDDLYNTQDTLDKIIYPSGRSVALNPDIFGRPSNVGSVVSTVAYHPNNTPKTISFANGQTQAFGVNDHRLVSSMSVGNFLNFEYQYDGNLNIEHIIDHFDSINSKDMTYDGLSRLTGVSGGVGQYSFKYDAVDNLSSKIVNGQQYSYQYDAASNRLQSITNSSYNFGYDAYGNVTSNGTRSYIYDDAGRLTQSGVHKFYYDGNSGKTVIVNDSGETILSLYTRDGLLRFKKNYSSGLLEEYFYIGRSLVGVSRICQNEISLVKCSS